MQVVIIPFDGLPNHILSVQCTDVVPIWIVQVGLLRAGIAEMRTLLTEIQAQHNILLTQPSQESKYISYTPL